LPFAPDQKKRSATATVAWFAAVAVAAVSGGVFESFFLEFDSVFVSADGFGRLTSGSQGLIPKAVFVPATPSACKPLDF